MSDTGSFDEIRALLAALPDADAAAAAAAAPRAEALGGPGSLYAWLAAWQGRARPQLERPRLCVFASGHGIAVHAGIDAAATQARLQALIDGDAPAHRLCERLDADLRAYDMAIGTPTDDACRRAASSEPACVRDLAYGMMSVDPGIDLLGLDGFGAGDRIAAAALLTRLYGGAPTDWLEPHEAPIAARALARHGADADPLHALASLGGREIAAVAGAIVAARLARTPVVLDGFVATVAAAVVHALDDGAIDHCRLARIEEARGHEALAGRLGLAPILGPAAGGGDGVAAALGASLLRTLVAAAG
ncbi:MAG: nicotinate-nucleotide--dimethylbenzimidazole phosphoribosyltransferase [Rhodospirillales bacterium]